MSDSSTIPARDAAAAELPAAPWAHDGDALAQALGVDPARGLPAAEVRRRRAAFGENRVRSRPPRAWWRIAGAQFTSLIVWLLVAGALAAFAAGKVAEGVAIALVLVVNGAIGFVMELRAVRSMEALRALERTVATVRRGGEVVRVPAQTLVPGDVVLVEAGDVVSADVRLLEASRLAADESTLTGESLPTAKHADPLDGTPPLADRANMLHKGTAVTRGAGAGLVVATGARTELGRIGDLVATAEEGETPLERRLGRFGRRLAWVTLVVAAFVAAAGLVRGEDPFLIVETAVALAVAAVPEGLPVIATIALARGMRRMARRRALVNRLAAVETLGGTTHLIADKTGTLTENRLVAERVVTAGGEHAAAADAATDDPVLKALLEAAALCNDAEPSADGIVGDPVDAAFLRLAETAGVAPAALRAAWPRVHEEAFDPALRLMGTSHARDGAVRIAVKGGFEAVLAHCVAERTAAGDVPLDDAAVRRWRERHDALAAAGQRVLAVAARDGGPADAPYADLVLLGVVGIADPPRDGVDAAIAACRAAGIEVVMATGDHPATARAIAARIGLADEAPLLGDALEDGTSAERVRAARIVARMSPAQKLALLDLHREAGAVVAMTGDGVNDAPALVRADVGVAMGERGTDVARQAADIVLQDDHLATIVAAIREGRVIVGNLRAFVRYLLSCNASEVAVIGLATLLGGPLPVLPLQILYLNLVTDVFPALALGLGEGDAMVMARPPAAPGSALLSHRDWRGIAGHAASLTAAVLLAQQVALRALRVDQAGATAVAFLTLAFSQLWHVFNMRAPGAHPLRNAVTRNRWVWRALALCVALVLATAFVPPLSRILGVPPPSVSGWLLVLGCSVLPLLIGQGVALLRGGGQPPVADAGAGGEGRAGRAARGGRTAARS